MAKSENKASKHENNVNREPIGVQCKQRIKDER